MRSSVPAVMAGLVVAGIGAIILGEYELAGYRALVAGALFGAAVGEVIATVARRSDRYLLGAAALVTEAGLVWAVWISSGHRPDLAPAMAWFGTGMGTVVAPLWLRSADRRGAHSPAATSPSPGD